MADTMQMEIVLKAVDQARRTLEEAQEKIKGTGTAAGAAGKRFEALNASAQKVCKYRQKDCTCRREQ
ncbi:MAG: hypothetical protein ACOX2F_07215 [bacterium]